MLNARKKYYETQRASNERSLVVQEEEMKEVIDGVLIAFGGLSFLAYGGIIGGIVLAVGIDEKISVFKASKCVCRLNRLDILIVVQSEL